MKTFDWLNRARKKRSDNVLQHGFVTEVFAAACDGQRLHVDYRPDSSVPSEKGLFSFTDKGVSVSKKCPDIVTAVPDMKNYVSFETDRVLNMLVSFEEVGCSNAFFVVSGSSLMFGAYDELEYIDSDANNMTLFKITDASFYKEPERTELFIFNLRYVIDALKGFEGVDVSLKFDFEDRFISDEHVSVISDYPILLASQSRLAVVCPDWMHNKSYEKRGLLSQAQSDIIEKIDQGEVY